jgi:chemotaxis protein methyltransferase CheR
MIQRHLDITDNAELDFKDMEFLFTPLDFSRLADILRTDTGIVLERSKMPLVYARLAKRLRALDLKSFKKYCAFIASPEGRDEYQCMIEALTTNVTRFFREAHHFEHLKTRVLPALVAGARRGQRVRIWSAGCSTGEEPYSIALTILLLMPDASQFDIKVLATDIDTNVLHRGMEGLYTEKSLISIDSTTRARWFDDAGTVADEPAWRVGHDLQDLISFRRANLIGKWPMKGPFDVIFCRNTVIYFDEAARKQIWNKMVSLLAPGGHLYIGHSERMPIDADRLRQVGLTTYRNKERAA